MRKRARVVATVAVMALAMAACSSSGSDASAPTTTSAASTVPALSGPPTKLTPTGPGCSVLATRGCMYPFPNDEFTVADDDAATGRRVELTSAALPATTEGDHVDPTEWNRNDGFSPGQAIVVFVPGVDLDRSKAPKLTDLGASVAAAQRSVVVLDAATGARQPIWAEIDTRSKQGGDKAPAVIVRPARNWTEGHRYVVGLSGMVDAAGTPIAAPPAFAAVRDDVKTDSAAVEAQRPHLRSLFPVLAKAGLATEDLYLAWDFTVASEQNLSERVLAMRDDAMDALGPDGAPPFAVTPTPADETADGGARIVHGTFDVPLYLTGKGEPGSRLTKDAKGLPVRNGTYAATFTCVLPVTAGPGPDKTVKPGLGIVYGHGLLGDQGEVKGFGDYAIAHDSVVCATDWIGLAEEDVPNAVAILTDLSNMPSMPDRVQQSFVNFQYLARLLKSPKGLSSDPAVAGQLAPGDVAFWGRSQGGIFGGGATAISTEWTRAVLGEPGINYSTLLERSVDFDEYAAIQRQAYPDTLDWPLLLGLMQMLWDRGEGNGYAAHMTDDPLPGTPEHTVMLFQAFGDHQVTNVATQVEARTIGAKLKTPALKDGRSPDVEPFWDIDPIGTLPADASVLYVWDFGTPAPPGGNIPNRAGDDPHDMDADTPEALDVVAAFLASDGEVIDACDAKPCDAGPIVAG